MLSFLDPCQCLYSILLLSACRKTEHAGGGEKKKVEKNQNQDIERLDKKNKIIGTEVQTTYLVRVAMQDPQECERVQNGAGVGAKNTNSNINPKLTTTSNAYPVFLKAIEFMRSRFFY